jgi:CubicO group peptidase (beta-lactamase class C family)
MIRVFLALFFPLCLFWNSGCLNDSDQRKLEQRVMHELSPAARFDGKTIHYDLESRMKHWNVPAVSMVIIDQMEIVFTGSYGTVRLGSDSPINENTLFQAASVSKPVTATGFMAFSQKYELDIDTDISRLDPRWDLPRNGFHEPVTPGLILSHAAGMNVGGFIGYDTAENLPSLTEVIKGLPPANSPEVRLVVKPGTRFLYSGGGYQILQKIMEDKAMKPFPVIMAEMVFDPLNMQNSHYAPLKPEQKGNAASGHMEKDHIPEFGPIHVESAAGGLWTTPTDLGNWLTGLMKAYKGLDGPFLDQTTVRTIMKPGFWDFGLGFKVLGEGQDLRFSHGGATRGWHCHFMAYPEREQGVVIMTNGTNGWVLWAEIERAVAKALGWPVPTTLDYTSKDLTSALLIEYEGTYNMPGGPEIQLQTDSTSMQLTGAGLSWTLVPVGTNTLQIMDMEGQVIFRRDSSNRIRGLHLWFDEPDWSPYRAWDFIKK